MLRPFIDLGIFFGTAWITWLYHRPISYWAMVNIFGVTERTARTNAGEPLVGVFTFFVLIIVILASIRLADFLFHAFLPPSMRPSASILMAVPPVIPRITFFHIAIMLTALAALIYLLAN